MNQDESSHTKLCTWVGNAFDAFMKTKEVLALFGDIFAASSHKEHYDFAAGKNSQTRLKGVHTQLEYAHAQEGGREGGKEGRRGGGWEGGGDLTFTFILTVTPGVEEHQCGEEDTLASNVF